jgi:ppGpp synthetase/RelA/SpoT-type nucleotidyltranferase
LANAGRTVEDRLREEYFDLLPDIRRVVEQLEAEIRYNLLIVSRELSRYERLVVTSRVKDCESALQKLRGFQEGKTFDPEPPEPYTLSALNDLAGVRVLVFPRRRVSEVDIALRGVFQWEADPIQEGNQVLALKYRGYSKASGTIKGEYQIMSMLTGLFWEVEHSAMYKPDLRLRGVARHRGMMTRRAEVLQALKAFEEQFEALIPGGQDK